ncbi:ABC transporter family substrate-binding protein [Nocardia salmonicida]|uniref:ABC transporter family substrate-binding protein n=1 Tax=Nocardia salmonicida TaxID=53431 RepID=UPI0007A3EEF3|nr:ABC transporter family substrate-binding protein [Nocardia salmonicida]
MTTATYARRLRRAGFRVAVPVFAMTLALGGCASDDSSQIGADSIGAVNDINPKDVSEVQDGGNFRLALTSFPETFNSDHVDASADASAVVGWTLPGTVTSNAAGELSIDHDYFTDIQLTGTAPQQVTYTINPKAVWSDGTPITWEDMRSQAQALSGKDVAYQVRGTDGFDRVEKVERGVDDRQAVVTFAKHYAEWKGMFNPLYPKASTESPASFENWARNSLPVSAGPFLVGAIDRAQQRITLNRNPKWWGNTPKLDTITFAVLDYSARMAALQNNELDAASISGIEEVKTAAGSPGLVVRRAPSTTYSHFTFNGAPGAILEDPQLRVAISKAIDRQTIANARQNGLVEKPEPLNNHIFMKGQKGYQDNSAPLSYDPAAAAKMLDDLGWKLNGDVREKDGRKLELTDVMYQQDAWVQIATIAQQNLAAVGVKLNIRTVPGNGLFKDVVDPGNFDIVQFSWTGGILPLGVLPQVYAYDPNNRLSNKGRIGSPELNALIEETIAELDPEKAIELANKADRMIFDIGFSLPIGQSPGAIAVRSTVANYGAFGLASTDATKVGFVK